MVAHHSASSRAALLAVPCLARMNQTCAPRVFENTGALELCILGATCSSAPSSPRPPQVILSAHAFHAGALGTRLKRRLS